MEKRGSIVGGTILILVGGFFLLLQLFPGVASALDLETYWPLIIVSIGALFLLAALLAAPPLAIPGSIVTGIGGILFYQNLTGNWDSWSYIWALIPGFVGIGMILMGILSDEHRDSMRPGLVLIVISLILFVVFGAFLGGSGNLGSYWPVFLIAGGAWMLFSHWRTQRQIQEMPKNSKSEDDSATIK